MPSTSKRKAKAKRHSFPGSDGMEPPNPKAVLWRFLTRCIGVRLAVIIVVVGFLLGVTLTYGPGLVDAVARMHDAYRSEFPNRPRFNTDKLNIGVAIFENGSHSAKEFERIALRVRSSDLITLHSISGVDEGCLTELPYSIVCVDNEIQKWVQETGADGAIWGFKTESNETGWLHLSWTRASYADTPEFLGTFGGLAAYLYNNTLAEPSISFPPLIQEEYDLASYLVSDFVYRAARRPSEYYLSSQERARIEAIRARICQNADALQCNRLARAFAQWELLLPDESETAVSPITRFDYRRALGFEYGTTPPRSLSEFRQYVALIAGLLRQAGDISSPPEDIDVVIEMLNIPPWRMGLQLEEELKGANVMLKGLRIDAEVARLVSAQYEARSTDSSGALNMHPSPSVILQQLGAFHNDLRTEVELSPFVVGVMKAALAIDLATIATMKGFQENRLELASNAVMLAAEASDHLLDYQSRVPRMRSFLVQNVGLRLLPLAMRLPENDVAALTFAIEKVRCGSVHPADRALMGGLEAQSILWETRLRVRRDRPIPCDIIARWSDAERMVVDGGGFTMSSRYPPAPLMLFRAFIAGREEDEARNCLGKHGYDYDRILDAAEVIW